MRLVIANKNYSSWSLRPWVLLRERGVAFAEVVVPFEADGGHAAAFLALSPTGRVPVLHDGSVVVLDSLAIAEYLAERDAAVWPADSVARAWARSASAEMHSGFATLRSTCSMSCGHRVRLHSVTPALTTELQRLDALWAEGLIRFGGPFLAGPCFTAVDAMFAPVAFRLQTYGLRLGEPAMAWVATMLALPSMVDWYEAGLAEPFRDEGHDASVAEAGVVLADLRVARR